MTNLCIADWNIRVDATLSLLLADKYTPFYTERLNDGCTDNLLFTLDCSEINSAFPEEGYLHICDNGTYWSFYPQADGWLVKLYLQFYEQTYRIRTDKEWKHIEADGFRQVDESDACALDNILMLAFAIASAEQNTVLIHSSCVKTRENEGIAFIGQSGAGKSTHSQLWLRYVEGCELLNDDQPVIRLDADRVPWLYGTPWSGKGECYKQEKVRLKVLGLMRQASENHLIPLNSIAAYTTVLSAVSVVREMTEAMKGISNTAATIALQTDIFILENRPEKEAVALSAGRLGIKID